MKIHRSLPHALALGISRLLAALALMPWLFARGQGLPPTVSTLPASLAGLHRVMLNGTAGDGGVPNVSIWFDWGLSTAYGYRAIVGNTNTGIIRPYSGRLDNLIAGATYHYRIAASNRAGLSLGKDASFTLTTPLALTQASYSPLTNVGHGTGWVASGDFNGDGLPDLACNNGRDDNVTVLLGVAGGGFTQAPGSPLPTDKEPMTIAAADFDGDGKLDLVTANRTGGTVTLLLGDGSGRFHPAPGSPFAAGLGPWGLAVADFNADGHPDVIVANFKGPGVTVLLGDGKGGFLPAIATPLANVAKGLAVVTGDIDGDGQVDAVVSGAGDRSLHVLFGDGRGGFLANPRPVLATSSSGDFSVALADLDGDGKADVVGADTYNNTVTVYLNDAAGAFANPKISSYPVGPVPRWVGAVDVDGDGILDLATADEGGTMSVLLADGVGGFAPAPGSPFVTGSHPNALAVTDLDGDGRPDFVCANGGVDQTGLGAMTVYLNPLVSQPRPSIESGSAVVTGPNSATLSGSVMNLRDPVTAWFEWGTNSNYGTVGTAAPLPAGFAVLPVSLNLSDLVENQEYHCRLVTFDGASTNFGVDVSFVPVNPFLFTSDGGSVTVTGYTADSTVFVIPDKIGGLPVTEIGDGAFYEATALTGITLPNTVTRIGDHAFDYCPSLTRISIPNSVTNIGAYAFSECYALTNIIIPESVTSIGQQAFGACWGLTGVAIPKSVTALGDEPFYDCINLGSILTETGNPAYQSLDGVLFDRSLTTLVAFPGGRAGSYVVPDSVTGVGVHAFDLCLNLQRVTLGRAVTTIGAGAFSECYALTNIVLNDGLLRIGDGAFLACNALQNVVIPKSVLAIGSSAFDTSVVEFVGGGFGPPYPQQVPGDLSAYFLGGPPAADMPFGNGNQIAVYYLPASPGWGPSFGGAPTAVWLPRISVGVRPFSVRDGQFGFNVFWAPGSSVVVEATDSLTSPTWTPLATQVFDAGGNTDFSDPDWTNHSTRLYRVRLP